MTETQIKETKTAGRECVVDSLAHVIEKSGGVAALDVAGSRGSNDVTELYLFPGVNITFLCFLCFFLWLDSLTCSRDTPGTS